MGKQSVVFLQLFCGCWEQNEEFGVQTWSWRVAKCQGPNGKESDSENGRMVPLQRKGADVIPRAKKCLTSVLRCRNTAAVQKIESERKKKKFVVSILVFSSKVNTFNCGLQLERPLCGTNGES